jgi:Plasma-membrane choline transporter
MATWCFDKDEANQCCSPAVYSSVYRSLTYSFGSICFGSLLQALITVFRIIVNAARRERERNRGGGGDGSLCGSIWLCILECLASLLESVIEYFNQWAYVYVGIYGFSYLDSGKRAMTLFQERGWSAIITDNLVGYVLGFISFTVGVLSGAAAVGIDALVSSLLHDPKYDSFIFGPIPGWQIWAFM